VVSFLIPTALCSVYRGVLSNFIVIPLQLYTHLRG